MPVGLTWDLNDELEQSEQRFISRSLVQERFDSEPRLRFFQNHMAHFARRVKGKRLHVLSGSVGVKGRFSSDNLGPLLSSYSLDHSAALCAAAM